MLGSSGSVRSNIRAAYVGSFCWDRLRLRWPLEPQLWGCRATKCHALGWPRGGEACNGRRRRRLPLRDRVMDDGQPDLSAGDALPQMARQALEANQLELVLS
jgi:hypothetical protein